MKSSVLSKGENQYYVSLIISAWLNSLRYTCIHKYCLIRIFLINMHSGLETENMPISAQQTNSEDKVLSCVILYMHPKT